MTGRSKVAAVLSALVLLLGGTAITAPPAQAHTSVCTKTAFTPKKLAGTKLVRATFKWNCPNYSHHSYVASTVTIQYWQERKYLPDGWAGIPPQNMSTSKRLYGQNSTTVQCANGTKTYRTKVDFYLVGYHGVVKSKVKPSYETTFRC